MLQPFLTVPVKSKQNIYFTVEVSFWCVSSAHQNLLQLLFSLVSLLQKLLQHVTESRALVYKNLL